MEQLTILAGQAGVDALPIVQGQLPADIARRAIQAAKFVPGANWWIFS